MMKIKPFAIVLFLLSPASLWAVDAYEFSNPGGGPALPNGIMIAAPNALTITVTAMQGGVADPTPTAHRIRFVNLPTGVSVTPNDPTNGVTITGTRNFTVSAVTGSHGFYAAGLKVENVSDPLVKGQMDLTVHRVVSQFVVSPPGGGSFTGTTGVPFNLTIQAQDSLGNVVPAFQDSVTLSADVGDITADNGSGTTIPGRRADLPAKAA
jgi:hypothetical protein